MPQVGTEIEQLRKSLFDTHVKRCASVSKGMHVKEIPLSDEATGFLSTMLESALEVCRWSQAMARGAPMIASVETSWCALWDRLLLSSFGRTDAASVDREGKSFVFRPR